MPVSFLPPEIEATYGRYDRRLTPAELAGAFHFIDDEAYRRRILGQVNRTEKRHDLARTVFHGKKGELRQAYQEGQEDQLGALGLVVNAIVLWNTRYIDAALETLRSAGVEVSDDVVAGLSPLRYEHINLHGRYHFQLPDVVRRGALRELRQPM